MCSIISPFSFLQIARSSSPARAYLHSTHIYTHVPPQNSNPHDRQITVHFRWIHGTDRSRGSHPVRTYRAVVVQARHRSNRVLMSAVTQSVSSSTRAFIHSSFFQYQKARCKNGGCLLSPRAFRNSSASSSIRSH